MCICPPTTKDLEGEVGGFSKGRMLLKQAALCLHRHPEGRDLSAIHSLRDRHYCQLQAMHNLAESGPKLSDVTVTHMELRHGLSGACSSVCVH